MTSFDNLNKKMNKKMTPSELAFKLGSYNALYVVTYLESIEDVLKLLKASFIFCFEKDNSLWKYIWHNLFSRKSGGKYKVTRKNYKKAVLEKYQRKLVDFDAHYNDTLKSLNSLIYDEHTMYKMISREEIMTKRWFKCDTNTPDDCWSYLMQNDYRKDTLTQVINMRFWYINKDREIVSDGKSEYELRLKRDCSSKFVDLKDEKPYEIFQNMYYGERVLINYNEHWYLATFRELRWKDCTGHEFTGHECMDSLSEVDIVESGKLGFTCDTDVVGLTTWIPISDLPKLMKRIDHKAKNTDGMDKFQKQIYDYTRDHVMIKRNIFMNSPINTIKMHLMDYYLKSRDIVVPKIVYHKIKMQLKEQELKRMEASYQLALAAYKETVNKDNEIKFKMKLKPEKFTC